jgi:hypothetical protein
LLGLGKIFDSIITQGINIDNIMMTDIEINNELKEVLSDVAT